MVQHYYISVLILIMHYYKTVIRKFNKNNKIESKYDKIKKDNIQIYILKNK